MINLIYGHSLLALLISFLHHYKKYEETLMDINKWYQYQRTLYEILFTISDLKYTLYLGVVSAEECSSLLPVYRNQCEDVQLELINWHQANMEKLNVDLSESHRKREGFDSIIHWIPGKINDSYNYKSISEDTVNTIGYQFAGSIDLPEKEFTNLYEKNVRLIFENDNVYYIPDSTSISN